MPSPELFCGNTSCGVRFGILGSNPREETSAGPEGFARNKKSGFEMDMNLARGLEQEIIKRMHLSVCTCPRERSSSFVGEGRHVHNVGKVRTEY